MMNKLDLSNTENYWLQCIANAEGNITKEQFFEDCEPIGPLLWSALKEHVTIDKEGKLHVSRD